MSFIRQYWHYLLLCLLLLLVYSNAIINLLQKSTEKASFLYASLFFGVMLLLLNGYVLYIQQEKHKKSNQTKTDFLIHMNHAIRTPLAVICGIAEIFDAQANLDDKQKKLVKTLISSTSSLKVLADDILKFSKSS